jgi:biotin operon repressor
MRQEWTKEEVRRLKPLADGKVSADYIAKLLKRSVTSVKANARRLKVKGK